MLPTCRGSPAASTPCCRAGDRLGHGGGRRRRARDDRVRLVQQRPHVQGTADLGPVAGARARSAGAARRHPLHRRWLHRRSPSPLSPVPGLPAGAGGAHGAADLDNLGRSRLRQQRRVRRRQGQRVARAVFVDYHAHAGFGDGERGMHTRFRRGPVELLLDTRSFADGGPSPLATGERTLLGEGQLAWLQAGLRASTAPCKVLAGGVVWNQGVRPNKADCWGNWLPERDALLRWLGSAGIEGVVLQRRRAPQPGDLAPDAGAGGLRRAGVRDLAAGAERAREQRGAGAGARIRRRRSAQRAAADGRRGGGAAAARGDVRGGGWPRVPPA